MPPGADAVVQVELTDAGTERVAIHAEVKPGTHLRRAGEDVGRRRVVLRAGTRARAGQLGLAAAVGAGDAAGVPAAHGCWCCPPASELVEPGNPLLPGQIYESNGVMLAAAVRSVGGWPSCCGSCRTTSTPSTPRWPTGWTGPT